MQILTSSVKLLFSQHKDPTACKCSQMLACITV